MQCLTRGSVCWDPSPLVCSRRGLHFTHFHSPELLLRSAEWELGRSRPRVPLNAILCGCFASARRGYCWIPSRFPTGARLCFQVFFSVFFVQLPATSESQFPSDLARITPTWSLILFEIMFLYTWGLVCTRTRILFLRCNLGFKVYVLIWLYSISCPSLFYSLYKWHIDTLSADDLSVCSSFVPAGLSCSNLMPCDNYCSEYYWKQHITLTLLFRSGFSLAFLLMAGLGWNMSSIYMGVRSDFPFTVYVF